MGRVVAIKVMSRAAESNPQLLHRFYGEARAVAKLQHPNIVGCLDAGRHGAARDYYVMELIPGQDLQSCVAASGPLPPTRACELFRQLADALTEAHAHDVVHRDIKPENIMLRKDGIVQIMDFGLAKLRSAGSAINRLTKEGSTVGTAGYMSPEQVQGQDADHRSDIFSLGVVLYEMFTHQIGRASCRERV